MKVRLYQRVDTVEGGLKSWNEISSQRARPCVQRDQWFLASARHCSHHLWHVGIFLDSGYDIFSLDTLQHVPEAQCMSAALWVVGSSSFAKVVQMKQRQRAGCVGTRYTLRKRVAGSRPGVCNTIAPMSCAIGVLDSVP